MRGVVAGWNRFWFEPTPTGSLALLRLAFGTLIVLWAISVVGDLSAFYTSRGIVPEHPQRDWWWGVLQLNDSDGAVWAVWATLLVAGAALAVGAWTRLAAVLVFVAFVSLQRRNPFIDNAGDQLLRVIAFYLVLAPAGASLSVDRWRRSRATFWELPARAPWALRLVQIQVSVIYVSTVWEKVRGTTWNDGTAVSYALGIEELVRLPVPDVVTDSLVIMNVATWGTLAVELALAILVWNTRWRPWVLLLGVALHLSIDLTMTVGFFSLSMFVVYLAFLPDAAVERVVVTVREIAGRLSRAPQRPAIRVAGVPSAAPVSAAPRTRTRPLTVARLSPKTSPQPE